MLDTIVKGTGNSRTLRTVPNAMTLYSSWTEALQAMIDGTFPIDIGPLNLAGLIQKGTDLNKANLLTDETAALYGLDETATPNDIFQKLSSLFARNVSIGSYVGTSNAAQPNAANTVTYTDWNEKTVGFEPYCVILLPDNRVLYGYESSTNYFRGGIFGKNFPLTSNFGASINLECAKISNNGFMVRNARQYYSSTQYSASCDGQNVSYRWIAFR